MPVPDFAQGVKAPFFSMVDKTPWPPAPKTVSAADAASPNAQFTFDDFLDVINPMQHLPVVSTLYRAVTGDTIKDPEKLIGDTIYGGPLGFAASVADLAFKQITGKNFGDTILAGITGDDSIGAAGNTALAANKPATSQEPAAAAQNIPPETIAQMQAAVAQSIPAATLAQTIAPAPIAQTAGPRAVSQPAATGMPRRIVPQAPLQSPVPTAAIAGPSSAQLAAAIDGSTSSTPDLDALTAMIRKNGLNADLGMRATLAYQQSLGMSPDPGALAY